MKIALDVMGGDNAPDINVDGAKRALQDFPLIEKIYLVGREETVRSSCDRWGLSGPRVEIVPAAEVVEMNESGVLAGISSRSAHTTLAWQFLRELTANADNQSMLFTDSHSVSALRSVTDSEKTRQILRQDTPGESRSGVEMLSDVMEQAVAAPRFRNYDQALLLTEGLVQTAMEDEHNLSLQLQRVQHEVQEYLQKN